MPTLRSGHRPSARDVIHAIGHLVWTTAIVVGAPYVLAHLFGWPLPTQIPDWRSVTSTPLQLVDPTVILNTLVCAAWVCWFVIASYVVLDLVDAAVGVGQRVHRIGPFGTVAGKLVGSLVLLVSLARPATAVAAPLPTTVVPQIDLPAAPPSARAPSAAPTVVAPTASLPSEPTYVVQRGDSLWAIAETHLGTGFRWTEIHDLNRDLIADPDVICTGWQLTMPVDAAGLTAIESLAAPPTSFDPTASVPPTPAPVELQASSAVPETDQGSISPTPRTADNSPGPSDALPTLSSPADERVPGPPPGTRSIEAITAASEEDDELLPALAPALPGITGATVLATAVLVALRHRQRKQTRPRSRSGPRDAERAVVAAADVALVRWVGQELSLLGEQLAGRGFEATPIAVEFSEDSGIEVLWDRPAPDAPAPWEAVPGAWSWRTSYDPEAPIPAAELPSVFAGFVTVGERDGRQLLVNLEAFGSIAVTGDPERVDSLIRSIAVELSLGDEIADANVAITQGAFAESLDENVASIEVVDPTTAVSCIRSAAVSTTDLLEVSNIGTTFAYRMTDTPLLPLEVTIAVGHNVPEDSAQALVDASPPHRGVGVVVTDPSAGATATVTIAADGRARLEPLDLAFTAGALPTCTASEIRNLLNDGARSGHQPDLDPAANAPALDPEADAPAQPIYGADPGTGGPATGDTVAEEFSVRVAADSASRRTVIDLREDGNDDRPIDIPMIPEPRMLIKVLGQPRIVDGPPLGRRELALVVYVACAGRPVRHDHIQDAIWGGDAVSRKSVFNLIGATRTALGTWDGEPILMRAVRPGSTITLQDGVTTDLELLGQLYHSSCAASADEALELLDRGLDLVEGRPFDADGYDWAHAHQLVHEAELLIEDVACLVGSLALDAGVKPLVRRAVHRGLLAVPGSARLLDLEMTELRLQNHVRSRPSSALT